MSPRRSSEETSEPETSNMNDTPDAEDPRTFEHDAAEAVRDGVLSAAQLPGGHGNVDPDNPDAQYPPGVVDNTATVGDVTADPASFVPERKQVRSGTDFAETEYRSTDVNPDYA